MEEELENIQEEQKTYGKRVYVYFFFLFMFVGVVLLVKAKWQQHVPARQIVIEGLNILSRDDVLHLIKIPSDVSMYNLDLTVLQQNIMQNSFVKNAVVKRDAPEQLLVTVEERKPAAILVTSAMHYIDEDGVVLPYVATTETYDIPVITGYDSTGGIRSGQRITNNDVLEALNVIRTSKSVNETLFHTISEIRLRKGHDIVLYSFDEGIPIIFGKGDEAKKLVKLDSFWESILQNSDTKDIRYIDIRFDDQVIVSRKSS
jgi:cell division protein FtsQ